MTKIVAYKTEDGQIHGTELLAVQHQHGLNLRGFFNRHVGRDSVSVSEVVRAMQRHQAELKEIIAQHERTVGRIARRKAEAKEVTVAIA